MIRVEMWPPKPRRYRDVPRCIGANLWIHDRKYFPRARSMLGALWTRVRWQLRRWRRKYGY